MSIAIIGIGNWGKNLIREFSKISIISHCISQGNKANVNWLRQNYPHIIHTVNFESILKNPTITSIIIATPIPTHYDLALRSLNNGKNVFIEKTISETSSDASQLLKIAKQKKLHLFVGHVFNYHPIFQKIVKLNKTEKIVFMKFDWFKTESSNENILLDLASHDLFLISRLFGQPKSIKLISSFKNFHSNDIVMIEVKFSHKICILDINRCFPKKSKIVTFQTKKGLYVWDDYSLYKYNYHTKRFILLYKSKKTSLELECKEFLKTNKKLVDFSNAEYSINVLKLIEKIKH